MEIPQVIKEVTYNLRQDPKKHIQKHLTKNKNFIFKRRLQIKMAVTNLEDNCYCNFFDDFNGYCKAIN